MEKCKCATCIYRAAYFDRDYKCDYILITGVSRGCKGGNECEMYKQGERLNCKDSVCGWHGTESEEMGNGRIQG